MGTEMARFYQREAGRKIYKGDKMKLPEITRLKSYTEFQWRYHFVWLLRVIILLQVIQIYATLTGGR